MGKKIIEELLGDMQKVNTQLSRQRTMIEARKGKRFIFILYSETS